MSLDQDIELLSRVALFESFQAEHLRLLAFGAEKRMFNPGSVIFHRGSAADCGYVVVSGTVELKSDDPDDSELMGRYGQASLIGEMAMISSFKRNITAVAANQVELIQITRILFRRMLEEFPELASLLHARISNSVQNFVTRLEHIQRDLDRIDAQ